jgi:hypothetical protein
LAGRRDTKNFSNNGAELNRRKPLKKQQRNTSKTGHKKQTERNLIDALCSSPKGSEKYKIQVEANPALDYPAYNTKIQQIIMHKDNAHKKHAAQKA